MREALRIYQAKVKIKESLDEKRKKKGGIKMNKTMLFLIVCGLVSIVFTIAIVKSEGFGSWDWFKLYEKAMIDNTRLNYTNYILQQDIIYWQNKPCTSGHGAPHPNPPVIQEQQQSIQGDCNGDGNVTFADYLQLEAQFHKDCTQISCICDFNGDGTVSYADYLILKDNFQGALDEPA